MVNCKAIEEFVCNATCIYYYRTPQQNGMSNMALPCPLKDIADCTPDDFEVLYHL